MRRYFFLASTLPELQIGVPPELSFEELAILLDENLRGADREKVWTVRLYYDLLNLRLFWRGEPLSRYGNYNENELEEAILTQEGFPSYVNDFLERHESKEERLAHFASLLVDYFSIESVKARGFLREYLTFERGWRLVFTAFRAKKEGRDLLAELQYEDPYDDLVAQLLAQKDSPSYDPPDEYHHLKPLFDEYSAEPMELHRALCAYRFEEVTSFTGIDMMSITPILSYTIRLIIVEQWLELDKNRGMEIVDTILKEAT